MAERTAPPFPRGKTNGIRGGRVRRQYPLRRSGSPKDHPPAVMTSRGECGNLIIYFGECWRSSRGPSGPARRRWIGGALRPRFFIFLTGGPPRGGNRGKSG